MGETNRREITATTISMETCINSTTSTEVQALNCQEWHHNQLITNSLEDFKAETTLITQETITTQDCLIRVGVVVFDHLLIIIQSNLRRAKQVAKNHSKERPNLQNLTLCFHSE